MLLLYNITSTKLSVIVKLFTLSLINALKLSKFNKIVLITLLIKKGKITTYKLTIYRLFHYINYCYIYNTTLLK
jgi:hypothetical protein